MSTTKAKWYVVNEKNKEVRGTRGHSKEEATELLAVNMNMLHGGNRPWDYWHKQGFKVRRDK